MKPDFFKIIPKPKEVEVRWVGLTFALSLVLLGVLIAGFFLLKKENSSLEKEKALIEERLVGSKKDEQKALEKELFTIQEKIKEFFAILKNRNITQNFFPLFESLIHPKVQITQFSADIKNLNVALSGKTDGFESLAEQLLVFSQSGNVENLTLSNLAFDRDGNLDFGLTFYLSSKIFKSQ